MNLMDQSHMNCENHDAKLVPQSYSRVMVLMRVDRAASGLMHARGPAAKLTTSCDQCIKEDPRIFAADDAKRQKNP